MVIANVEVECPYCGKTHIYPLEYGVPTIIAETVEDDGKDKDNGPD